MELMIVAGMMFFVFFGMAGYLFSRFRTCPSDKILVVYGQTGTGKSSKCIHGGGIFVLPIIQDYQYLDLTPIGINIEVKDALCLENTMLNVSSKFTFGISTEPSIMENAAERLLGQSQQAIQDIAKDIIMGQIRLVIAQIGFEAIKGNKEKITNMIATNVDKELGKIGLKLININIDRITDKNSLILI